MRIFNALSEPDEFLLNQQVQAYSVAVPGKSRNNNSENREATESRSLNDPCLEGVFSACHTCNLYDSEQEETHEMVTAVQERIPYCSPVISSGKQKKERFTSQPQFCSENTLATFEAYQILVALKQLATSSNSTNFNNNINRFSKMPKTLTNTMLTCDGKSEKFELFDDLFQTSLKIYNQVTSEDKKSTCNRSCVVMHHKRLKTSPASKEHCWEKFRLCSLKNT